MNRRERQRQEAVFGAGRATRWHDPATDTVDRTPITPIRSLLAASVFLVLGHFVCIMSLLIFSGLREGTLPWVKIAITALPAVFYLFLVGLTIRVLYRYAVRSVRFLLCQIFPKTFHDSAWTPEGIGTFSQEVLMAYIGVLTPFSATLFVTGNWHMVPKGVLIFLAVCAVVLLLRVGKPIPRVVGTVLGRSEIGPGD